MAHTKRIAAPGFWRTGKKTKYWVVTPKPGPHPMHRSLPLLVLLRDVLRAARNARESKAILREKLVKVDGKVRTNVAYPVGLMDVVQVGEKFYRILPYRLGLRAVEIANNKEESGLKLLRVTGENTLPGGKLQVSMHDGRNLQTSPEGHFGMGDSVLFDIGTNKPVEVLKMEKGATVLIFDGTHRGEVARVVSVQNNGQSPNTVILEAGKKSFETLTDYVLVVSPKVSLPAAKERGQSAGGAAEPQLRRGRVQ